MVRGRTVLLTVVRLLAGSQRGHADPTIAASGAVQHLVDDGAVTLVAVGTAACSRLAANGRGTQALATRRMGASRS